MRHQPKLDSQRYGRTWVYQVKELQSDWLPFVPGMLGSRKKGGELRDVYSGVDPVPVRAGRWWEVGSTPFEGARIKEWRPHWSILHKSHAEDAALYGSEEEKWKHNPILHPDEGFPSFGLFWNHRKELPQTRRIFTYLHMFEPLAPS